MFRVEAFSTKRSRWRKTRHFRVRDDAGEVMNNHKARNILRCASNRNAEARETDEKTDILTTRICVHYSVSYLMHRQRDHG